MTKTKLYFKTYCCTAFQISVFIGAGFVQHENSAKDKMPS